MVYAKPITVRHFDPRERGVAKFNNGGDHEVRLSPARTRDNEYSRPLYTAHILLPADAGASTGCLVRHNAAMLLSARVGGMRCCQLDVTLAQPSTRAHAGATLRGQSYHIPESSTRAHAGATVRGRLVRWRIPFSRVYGKHRDAQHGKEGVSFARA